MVFSSFEFLCIFLPVLCIVYAILPSIRWKNGLLIIGSLLFYAYGEPVYVLLMIGSSLVHYLLAMGISKSASAKKPLLALDVILSLVVLGLFKYTGMIVTTINQIAHSNIPVPAIVMPIGISFFTFQSMSYVIDVYRERVEVQTNFFKVLLYISFFPQLIAGPIVKYRDISKEIDERHTDAQQVMQGLQRFIIGLSKKVLISNTVGQVADHIFAAQASSINGVTAWLAAISYLLQIYYDFSGYSDMAIGLGQVFGFHFRENFDHPYDATCIRDFWRKWHISLSSWFKDYVYIPLGGNRKGKVRTAINKLIVFFLTGLWHGANWTFVLWGCLHGILLGLNKYFKEQWNKLNDVLQWLITFSIINFLWILFRSDSIHDAIHFCTKLIACNFGAIDNTFNMCFIFPEFTKLLSIGHIYSSRYSIFTVFIFLLLILYILQEKNIINCVEEHLSKYLNLKHIVLFSVLFLWSIYSLGTIVSYIYVNF